MTQRRFTTRAAADLESEVHGEQQEEREACYCSQQTQSCAIILPHSHTRM